MGSMKKWGILGAEEHEIRLLTAAMAEVRTEEIAGQRYYDGILSGRPVTVVQCGIGKVCAAVGTQILIDRFGAEALWNLGAAGGAAPGLQIGSFAVCTDAVQYDFDATAFGYVPGYMCTGEDRQQPTRYAADAQLRRAFCQKAQRLFPQVQVVEGTIATGDRFVNDPRLKQELYSRYGAVAAEMEGAAAAQTAVLNGIPFLVVRAVSDLADGGATESYDTFCERVSEQLSQLLIALAGDPEPEET